jgi:hypothetical protein
MRDAMVLGLDVALSSATRTDGRPLYGPSDGEGASTRTLSSAVCCPHTQQVRCLPIALVSHSHGLSAFIEASIVAHTMLAIPRQPYTNLQS